MSVYTMIHKGRIQQNTAKKQTTVEMSVEQLGEITQRTVIMPVILAACIAMCECVDPARLLFEQWWRLVCARPLQRCSWWVERDENSCNSSAHTRTFGYIHAGVQQIKETDVGGRDALPPIKVANRNGVMKKTKIWNRGRCLWEERE